MPLFFSSSTIKPVNLSFAKRGTMTSAFMRFKVEMILISSEKLLSMSQRLIVLRSVSRNAISAFSLAIFRFEEATPLKALT